MILKQPIKLSYSMCVWGQSFPNSSEYLSIALIVQIDILQWFSDYSLANCWFCSSTTFCHTSLLCSLFFPIVKFEKFDYRKRDYGSSLGELSHLCFSFNTFQTQIMFIYRETLHEIILKTIAYHIKSRVMLSCTKENVTCLSVSVWLWQKNPGRSVTRLEVKK